MSKLDSYEYPIGSGIRIRERINTRGTESFGISYQVDIPEGVTTGKRIRKQFSSQKKAEAFAKEQNQGKKKQGEAYFNSTQQERNEFVDSLPKLRDAGIGVKEAIDFAIERMRPKGGDKYIHEIISELLKHKQLLLSRGQLRPDTVKSFRSKSKLITEEFGSLLIRNLKIEDVILWIDALELRDRTKKNYLTSLTEIIKYSVQKQYIFDNILDSMTTYERKELFSELDDSEPGILTIEESERLIKTAYDHPELGMLPVVTLGLFCGIRTEELQKLEWKDVRAGEGFVIISASIAKKRKIRNVTLPDNAKAWLSLCENKEGLIYKTENNSPFSSRFSYLLRKAGFVDPEGKKNSSRQVLLSWKKNAMRHSFGSYHYALHGDSIKTSNELGHQQGDNVLFNHYRALTSKESAKQYFDIHPQMSEKKIVIYG